MKKILVKELMIPISNYVTVKKTDNLVDVLQALESARQENEHAHRDAIVVDESGAFLGKVTMIDIFRALEPNYKKLMSGRASSTLTNDFVMKAVKEFNFWLAPEQTICQRGSKKTVAEVMHVPESVEFLQEDDTIEKALNLYVMTVHQPLIVKSGKTVTGVLRFGDIFEVVRKALLNCDIDQ
jgi:CBS domain containing-hemolysin-like protein